MVNKISELSFCKSLPCTDTYFSLTEEEKFIYNYGSFNCKYLKLKSFEECWKSFKEVYPSEDFSEKDIQFLKDHSNKEVLCYVMFGFWERPDIFIYSDDNISFPIECFV